MPKRGANISLSSYDDIFSTEESRADQAAEKVQEIPLSELHPFKNHTFKVLDDAGTVNVGEQISLADKDIAGKDKIPDVPASQIPERRTRILEQVVDVM